MQPEIEAYRDRGLRFVLITSDNEETIKAVLEEYELDVPVLSDPGDKIAIELGIQGWPSGLLFNRKGELVARTLGWGNDSLDKWKDLVEGEL